MPEMTNNSDVTHVLSAYLRLICINLMCLGRTFCTGFVNVSVFFNQLPAVSAHSMMKKSWQAVRTRSLKIINNSTKKNLIKNSEVSYEVFVERLGKQKV